MSLNPDLEFHNPTQWTVQTNVCQGVRKLEAQRTCSTQRMPFRDESTTRVDHKLASICVVPSVNQLSSFS